jgi:hypothetical protein
LVHRRSFIGASPELQAANAAVVSPPLSVVAVLLQAREGAAFFTSDDVMVLLSGGVLFAGDVVFGQ